MWEEVVYPISRFATVVGTLRHAAGGTGTYIHTSTEHRADPHKYAQLSFDRGVKAIPWKIQQMVLRQLAPLDIHRLVIVSQYDIRIFKHAVPNYLVKGTDLFSLRLSN